MHARLSRVAELLTFTVKRDFHGQRSYAVSFVGTSSSCIPSYGPTLKTTEQKQMSVMDVLYFYFTFLRLC